MSTETNPTVAEVIAERDRLLGESIEGWEAFRRVAKASEITEGQLDLMTQMRDSERARADGLQAERDRLLVALRSAHYVLCEGGDRHEALDCIEKALNSQQDGEGDG